MHNQAMTSEEMWLQGALAELRLAMLAQQESVLDSAIGLVNIYLEDTMAEVLRHRREQPVLEQVPGLESGAI